MPKIPPAALYLAITVAFGPSPALAQVPEGYDAAYQEILTGAQREGMLTVSATTDIAEVAGLLDDFRSRYPAITLDYRDQNSSEIYNRVVAEAAAGTGTSDLVWSSAMDLQIKLVNDGYAMPYASPEAAFLPRWAVWRDEAYGISAEPVTIVYNRNLVPEAEVPRTHAALARLLAAKSDAYKGKVATYDPERSSAGFLFLTQDIEITRSTWDLVRAMGQTGVKLYTSTEAMLARVASGETLIAYNIIGSYAAEFAKHDPAVGIVPPADYTIVMSRIAFIPQAAKHPNAARLFLDHLLSRDGQRRLAAQSMTPVRTDVEGDGLSADLARSRDAARPIHVGPELLTWLDQAKRAKLLKDWQRALQSRLPEDPDRSAATLSAAPR